MWTKIKVTLVNLDTTPSSIYVYVLTSAQDSFQTRLH